jgi:hypothetical protein
MMKPVEGTIGRSCRTHLEENPMSKPLATLALLCLCGTAHHSARPLK